MLGWKPIGSAVLDGRESHERNKATKSEETADFKRYKTLRDGEKAYYIEEGIRRQWLNQAGEGRGSSGISMRWPIVTNQHYKDALKQAEDGGSPNNISPIIRYAPEGGAAVMWMGDLVSCPVNNLI